MMQVGDIIEKGATSIPEEVLEFEDSDGDRARRNADGFTWSRLIYGSWQIEKMPDASIMKYFPLTVTKVAAPSPLVLSLPEVPENAVALTTRNRDGNEVRFVRDEPEGDRCWAINAPGDHRGKWALVEILRAFDGSATVEFAPPREPRTWPKIDLAPLDVTAFRTASGVVCRRWPDDSARALYRSELDGRVDTLHGWQLLDGPLTEVLD